MVGAAAGADGVLLERAQARRGLAGVEDARARALDRRDVAGGERGDPGQAAEEVERHALAGEDRGGGPVQLGERPGLAPAAVVARAPRTTARDPRARTPPRRPPSPAGTPGARCSIVALAVAPSGTTAAVVRSPVPRSSSRAAAITSSTDGEAMGTRAACRCMSDGERGPGRIRLRKVDVRAPARSLCGGGPAARQERPARAAGDHHPALRLLPSAGAGRRRASAPPAGSWPAWCSRPGRRA